MDCSSSRFEFECSKYNLKRESTDWIRSSIRQNNTLREDCQSNPVVFEFRFLNTPEP